MDLLIVLVAALSAVSQINGAYLQENEEKCMQFKISTYVPDCNINQIAKYTDEGINCIREECKTQLKSHYDNAKAQAKVVYDKAELDRDGRELKENILRIAIYTMVQGAEILHESLIKQNNVLQAAIKKIRAKSNGTPNEKVNAVRLPKLRNTALTSFDNVFMSTMMELLLIVTMEDNITTELRHLFDAKNTTAEIDAARKVYEIKVREVNEKIHTKIDDHQIRLGDALSWFMY